MLDTLIVDDDAFTRSGLSRYLRSLGYRVREAGDVQSAWDLTMTSPPSLAVIDVMLPLTPGTRKPPTTPEGLGFAIRLKKSYPTLGVVLFSAHQSFEKEVLHLAQQGLRGVAFLHKGGNMSRLDMALKEAQAGRTLFPTEGVNKYALATAVTAHFSPAETPWIEQALAEFERLSPREQEIAHLLSASYDTETIAARLGLSKGSVDNVVSRIYSKLGLVELRQAEKGLRQLPILIKACLLYDIRQSA